jgi:fucose 4-O-acetylase-like acetyltransferase
MYQKQKKKYYIGLEILRIFFSFNILLFHCLNKNIYSKRILNIIKDIAYLGNKTFFIIAFYFSHDLLSSKNITLIKQRFYRLFIPYIIWPTIMFITKNNIFYSIIYNNKIKLKMLFYQFLNGYGVYTVFWFSYNLIMVSLLLTIIIFVTKNYLMILLITSVFVYLYSTSKYYNEVLINYNKLIKKILLNKKK